MKTQKGVITPMVLLALVTFFLILGACAKPVIIPANLLAQETLCMKEVAKVQFSNNAANAKAIRYEFKDERNAVMVIAIEALAKSNTRLGISPFVPCTLTVQAFLQENGAVARSNNQITQKAIGVVGIVGGIWAAGNAIEGMLGAAGNTSAITGSRVVQNSDNYGNGSISSSGTGLGVGNTQGGADTVGGLYPRSQMDTFADGNGANSNSGEAVINMPAPVDAAAP